MEKERAFVNGTVVNKRLEPLVEDEANVGDDLLGQTEIIVVLREDVREGRGVRRLRYWGRCQRMCCGTGHSVFSSAPANERVWIARQGVGGLASLKRAVRAT